MSLPTLYYVHDPMCSWCWGFRSVWQQAQSALLDQVNIQYVLGGLAADTDSAMPVALQKNIEANWRQIQQDIPGSEFNFDFWKNNQARRSTYMSCRAVIAAGFQDLSHRVSVSTGPVSTAPLSLDMLFAIQRAYYLDAKNPSEVEVLVQLSAALGLNSKQFKRDLLSVRCEQLLQAELQLAGKLGVSSFPSLVLNNNGANALIYIDYTNSENLVSSILAGL